MKHMLALLLIGVVGCTPGRKEEDQGRLILCDHGKSGYSIVIPEGATATESYAAQEFQRIFKEICGVGLPVVVGGQGGDAHEIWINGTIPPEWTALIAAGRGGVLLSTERNRLILAGGRHTSVIHAVYEFFERYGGCRWLTRDVSVVPKRTSWILLHLHSYYRPSFEYRETFYSEGFDGDFAARLRSNGSNERLEAKHGGKLVYYPFVHTFYPILPPEKYFKEHPEYYAEIKGKRVGADAQLCLTNPDVLRLTIECVKQWIKEHPEATIYSVSQNDCYNNCTCPNCKAIDDREGGPSGSLLEFVNKVAEAIEKDHPDKLIDTLAYQYTRHPPKTARPRANVRVRLCSIECCFSHPIETCPQNQSFREDLIGWSKITDQLYIWDYVTDFAHYLLPFPNFDVFGPNARFFAEHGVKGVFEEGNYSEGGGGELSDLRTYVVARVLWDPTSNVPLLIEEFTDAVYGKAAPFVRAYLDLLHEGPRARNVHVNIWAKPNAPYLAGDFLERAEKLFDDGAAALKDDPASLKRLRKARLSINYVRYVRGKLKLADLKALCAEFGVTHVSEAATVESMK